MRGISRKAYIFRVFQYTIFKEDVMQSAYVPKVLRILLLISLFATVLSLSLWAGGQEEGASGEEAYTISFLMPTYKEQPPSMTNGVVDGLEELTGTDLEITWVPDATYAEKYSLLQVSGDLPKVTYLPKKLLRSGIWINAAQNGVFWEIPSEKIQSYENLKAAIEPATYRDAAIDGKLYGVPKSSWSALNGVFYRSDWLKNLGMEPPETLEQIYQVAKAFTHEDPDGNGKDDTYGFSYIDDGENETAWAGFDAFVVAAGGYNRWGIEAGNFIPYFDTPEYIVAMDLLRRLYAEELMNADFALVKGNQKYNAFNQGKVGIIYNYYTNLGGKFNDLLTAKNTPIAEARQVIDIVGALKDVDGNYTQPGSYPVSALFAINREKVKDESELDKVLSFFDASADFDGEYRRIIEWGIEGVHYSEVVDGKPVRSEEQNRLYDREVKEFTAIFRISPLLYPDWRETKSNPMVVYGYEKRIENNDSTVPNPATAYLSLSDTYIEKGKNIMTIISDARVKYIMGVINQEEFKDEVEKWYRQGGNDIIAEMEAVLNGQ
jgi:putative aldouronate transport system substrate-binding protein